MLRISLLAVALALCGCDGLESGQIKRKIHKPAHMENVTVWRSIDGHLVSIPTVQWVEDKYHFEVEGWTKREKLAKETFSVSVDEFMTYSVGDKYSRLK